MCVMYRTVSSAKARPHEQHQLTRIQTPQTKGRTEPDPRRRLCSLHRGLLEELMDEPRPRQRQKERGGGGAGVGQEGAVEELLCGGGGGGGGAEGREEVEAGERGDDLLWWFGVLNVKVAVVSCVRMYVHPQLLRHHINLIHHSNVPAGASA